MSPPEYQGTGDLTATGDPGGTALRDSRPRQVWARLTGPPGGAGADYPWVQLDESEASFPDLTNSLYPLAGTAASIPFREVTGNALVPYGTDGAKVRGDLSIDESCYVFIYGAGGGSGGTLTLTIALGAPCPVWGTVSC
jgi:hypothetical protein